MGEIVRGIAELVEVDDPGWPVVTDAIGAGGTECVVLPPDLERCRATLLQLQVTARSLLGAVVLNSGGLVLHHGWLRVYGGSGGELPSLAEVNGFPAQFDPAWAPQARLVVAHDVLGGVFTLDGSGEVVYFGPDTLEQVGLGGGHSQWLLWLLDGGAETFYAELFWPSWQEEVAELGLRDGISMYPPLWSKEGRENIAGTSRKAVPMRELHSLHLGGEA
ncbi:DUF2625 family protein [Lentzea sp. NPDC051213]|uniref:DUF2625 family protein n=1 Tax=Lentzea sp. NPDC051213 TaxID=3364126 RepID=UPI0037BB7572